MRRRRVSRSSVPMGLLERVPYAWFIPQSMYFHTTEISSILISLD